MKLKLDANGQAVLKDGMPVYIHDDNSEHPFDAKATVAKISQLNGEAQGHRERAEAAEKKLLPYKDITDPVAAIKALETVKNLDDKKLVDAGEVERVKAAVKESVTKEFAPIAEERDKLRTELFNEKIGGSFLRSPLLNGPKSLLVCPPDMAQAFFGKHFSIVDGKVIAKTADGKEIYSKKKHGELADFDEALEILVDSYPGKQHILRGNGASGGGAGQGKGGGGGGGADLSKLSPMDRLDAARAAGQT